MQSIRSSFAQVRPYQQRTWRLFLCSLLLGYSVIAETPEVSFSTPNISPTRFNELYTSVLLDSQQILAEATRVDREIKTTLEKNTQWMRRDCSASNEKRKEKTERWEHQRLQTLSAWKNSLQRYDSAIRTRIAQSDGFDKTISLDRWNTVLLLYQERQELIQSYYSREIRNVSQGCAKKTEGPVDLRTHALHLAKYRFYSVIPLNLRASLFLRFQPKL